MRAQGCGSQLIVESDVYGKSLLRRRGESVKRSFAPCYETGGMRNEAHASSRARAYSEATTDPCGSVQPESDPTGVVRFGQAAGVEESARRTAFAPLLVFLLLQRWNGPNRPAELASSIFSMSVDANHSIKRRRPCFRNSDPCTTGC